MEQIECRGAKAMINRQWPYWWDDPLRITNHARRRMRERAISETVVRTALQDCRSLSPQADGETWIACSILEGTQWRFVMKPNLALRVLEMITLYPLHE
jgi:hypothetical protein